MNKHATALAVKFIVIGLISVIILPIFSQITTGQAVGIALVLTLIAYFLADLVIVPRYGNITAVVADVIIAALVIGIADWSVNGVITLSPAGWVLVLAILGVGEWFLHKYLSISLLRVNTETEE